MGDRERADQSLMEWLRMEAAIERAKLTRQALLETFPGSSQGRALPSSPISREGGPSVPAVTIRRGGPAGEIIRLSGTSVSLASGGDYLASDTVVRHNGFGDVTSAGETITLPRTGLYDIELQFEWDSFEGGGTVEIEINGAVRRTHPDTGGSQSDEFEWSATEDARKGDTVKVKVTQSSGSAQAASWTLTVASKEPIKQAAVNDLHGHDNPASRPSSVTIRGNRTIQAGDVLVAFVSSAEPDVTMPAGWTNKATATGGDAEHRLDYRVAEAGDDGATWTWSATGGVSGDLSLAVTILVFKDADTAAPFDGTPGSDANYAGTATSLTPTTTTSEATSTLVLVAETSGPNEHSVSGMTRTVTYNDNDDMIHSAWESSAAGGAESETVTWDNASSGGAFLFAIKAA